MRSHSNRVVKKEEELETLYRIVRITGALELVTATSIGKNGERKVMDMDTRSESKVGNMRASERFWRVLAFFQPTLKTRRQELLME